MAVEAAQARMVCGCKFNISYLSVEKQPGLFSQKCPSTLAPNFKEYIERSAHTLMQEPSNEVSVHI